MKLHKILKILDSPALYLASHSNCNKCDVSESGFEMLRLPEQGLITTQNINPFHILHYTCTSLNYWCGNFAHDVHCCWYHMSTSFIGGSTYWFLTAFTQSFNRMWISLCLRSALVYMEECPWKQRIWSFVRILSSLNPCVLVLSYLRCSSGGSCLCE